MVELATKETARAAQMFTDYVNLGPDRSLAKLAAKFGKGAAFLRQLEYWSTEHQWQDRLKALAAAQLHQATELKTSTYVSILGEYHRRIVDDVPMRHTMHLNSLNSVFDRVKPAEPSGSGDGPAVVVQFAFIETTRGE